MTTNHVLEEVWAAREELSREAGGDIDRLCDQIAAGAERRERLMAKARSAGAEVWLASPSDEVLKPDAALREEPQRYGESLGPD